MILLKSFQIFYKFFKILFFTFYLILYEKWSLSDFLGIFWNYQKRYMKKSKRWLNLADLNLQWKLQASYQDSWKVFQRFILFLSDNQLFIMNIASLIQFWNKESRFLHFLIEAHFFEGFWPTRSKSLRSSSQNCVNKPT